MKGLLRGMVAVGLLASGVTGLGCSPEKGPRADTHKSSIHTRYQTPEAQEAQPVGEGPINRPTTERGQSGNARSSGGEGGVDPHKMPGTEGLGRGLNESNEAAPAQEGFGGAGQGTGATSPQQGQQGSTQHAPTTPHGE